MPITDLSSFQNTKFVKEIKTTTSTITMASNNENNNNNNNSDKIDIHIKLLFDTINDIQQLEGHDSFLAAFRDVEKRLFAHAKNDLSRQRRDVVNDTDFIITGISGLVKRLRAHKATVSKLLSSNEKVALKKMNRQYTETRSLSEEVRRILEGDIKDLGQVIRENEMRVKRAKRKLAKTQKIALEVAESSSSSSSSEEEEEEGKGNSVIRNDIYSSSDHGEDDDDKPGCSTSSTGVYHPTTSPVSV